MKKIIIIGILVILAISFGYAQTPIAPATTVAALSTMKSGVYSFYNGKDSIYFSKDSGTVLRTITTVCPKADSAGIIAVYVKAHPVNTCPPPVICPMCPAAPKQRTAIGITEMTTSLKETTTISYDDGTSTTF